MRTRLYLVDLDGVMNSSNLRNHLIPKTEMAKATAMGWLEWHKAHTIEAYNDEMIDFLNSEHANGNAVLFVSMRLDLCRDSTVEALQRAGLGFQPVLWMRAEDDDTPPPASRAGTVLQAIQMFGALHEEAHITLIDDSIGNVQAVHGCPRIRQAASDHGCRVHTVLYPAFMGVE